MTPRYASRRDENEPEVIEALEAAGWSVHRNDDGHGFPDLTVSKCERTYLIEVIGAEKAKKFRANGGLSDSQVTFRKKWGGIIHYVRSVEDALAVVAPARKIGGRYYGGT